MPCAVQSIERLQRDGLTSPSYRRLVSTLFGAASWETHVRYYRWLCEQNPSTRPDEPLPIYVCRVGDELVGHRTMIPSEVVFEGQHVRAGWGVDLYVLPTHQRQQIAARLLAAGNADFPLCLSLGQTEAGYQWAMKHGFHVAASLQRYARLLRPFRCVPKRIMQKAGLAGAARTLFGVPSVMTTRARYDVDVEIITSFVDRLDDPSDLRGNNPAHPRICRTPAFMQWRYFDNPFFRYEVRRFKLGPYGEAHAVWRVFDDALWRRGMLVDLVYPENVPQRVLALITAVVTECMRAAGVELFQCQTSDAAVLSAFGTGALATTQPGVRFLYSSNGGRARSSGLPEQWRLYPGDCDVDAHMARSSPP